MSRTDLLADSFTIIRNAIIARKEETVVPYSKLLLKVIEILKREGCIDNFKELDTPSHKQVKVYLRYENRKSVISGIRKVSKPGRRVYVAKDDVPHVLNGYGIAVLSTSSGVLTDREARKMGVGGEVLGYIW